MCQLLRDEEDHPAVGLWIILADILQIQPSLVLLSVDAKLVPVEMALA